jgi:acetyl esterase/lipase
MDRRELLSLGLGLTALGLMPSAFAEDMDARGRLSTDPTEVYPLWPGTPPGGRGLRLKDKTVERSTDTASFHDRFVADVGRPTLTVFRPQKPNGAAVLIAPGGGYIRIVLDKEGYESARFLAAAGVTAFVLRYRLPGEGWAGREDVPLQDAQRAMRLIRAGAKKFAIDPAHVGVMGFSAGGHVAASLATRFAAPVYKPRDKADGLDARPDFAALLYPVITMGEGCHAGSRDALLGPDPAPEAIAARSCENLVGAKTPPTFITFAADDPAVPPAPNGLAMFEALCRQNVPTELHAFEAGGHGFGIRLAAGKPCAAWPDLFLAWARSHAFVAKA